MENNPISNDQLAELDRLQHGTTPRPWLYGKVWLDHVPNYMAVIALHNAYPALRQRLLEAESRLAEAEADWAKLAWAWNEVQSETASEAADKAKLISASVTCLNSLAWLAARDAQQRREGAIEALEGIAKGEGIDGGKTYIAKVVYREFPDLMHTSVGVVDASDLMAAAKRLRERGE